MARGGLCFYGILCVAEIEAGKQIMRGEVPNNNISFVMLYV